MDIRRTMLDEFREELPATRRLLESVPEGHLEWQPHPKSLTLGQLAMHVATIPGSMARICRDESFDLAKRSRDFPCPKKATEVLSAFEQSARDLESAFIETSEERANASWRLMYGEREILSRPRFRIWRAFALNHLYHHRGQLTVYLRLLDIPVPPVYGPTADEQQH